MLRPNEQCFFGGSRPKHYLHAYAKAYANLRGLRGVPTRAQGSFQVLTRMPRRALVEFKSRSALWQLQLENRNFSVQVQFFGSSGSKIRSAAQVRIPHLSKDLAARKGLLVGKLPRKPTRMPTPGLREDSSTNRKKAEEANSVYV